MWPEARWLRVSTPRWINIMPGNAHAVFGYLRCRAAHGEARAGRWRCCARCCGRGLTRRCRSWPTGALAPGPRPPLKFLAQKCPRKHPTKNAHENMPTKTFLFSFISFLKTFHLKHFISATRKTSSSPQSCLHRKSAGRPVPADATSRSGCL